MQSAGSAAAYLNVLNRAVVRLPVVDATTARLLSNVRNGTGTYVNGTGTYVNGTGRGGLMPYRA